MSPSGVPVPGRPRMVASYGVPPPEAPGALGWEWAAERLTAAHNYWIATTRPDGRPHAMPIWGIWADGVLRFGTERASRKARNLIAQPSVVVHLESGEDTAIVEGTAAEVTGATAIRRFDDAYAAKYDTRLAAIPGDMVVYEVRPTAVLAWRESDFPVSATRWTFAR